MSKLIKLFKARQAIGMKDYNRALGTDIEGLEAMLAEELADVLVYREAIALKNAGLIVEDVWQHILTTGPRPDEFSQTILRELESLLEPG